MKFSPGAFTSGLAADPVHGDQRADQQGPLVEELGQAGAGLAFLWGKVATVAHNDLLYLIDINISDKGIRVKLFLNANLLPPWRLLKPTGFTQGYGKK
jgi:hypothetical protein